MKRKNYNDSKRAKYDYISNSFSKNGDDKILILDEEANQKGSFFKENHNSTFNQTTIYDYDYSLHSNFSKQPTDTRAALQPKNSNSLPKYSS